jgi:hypothetical protein
MALRSVHMLMQTPRIRPEWLDGARSKSNAHLMPMEPAASRDGFLQLVQGVKGYTESPLIDAPKIGLSGLMDWEPLPIQAMDATPRCCRVLRSPLCGRQFGRKSIGFRGQSRDAVSAFKFKQEHPK